MKQMIKPPFMIKQLSPKPFRHPPLRVTVPSHTGHGPACDSKRLACDSQGLARVPRNLFVAASSRARALGYLNQRPPFLPAFLLPPLHNFETHNFLTSNDFFVYFLVHSPTTSPSRQQALPLVFISPGSRKCMFDDRYRGSLFSYLYLETGLQATAPLVDQSARSDLAALA